MKINRIILGILLSTFTLTYGQESCVEKADAASLQTITLVGESHNAAAKNYWQKLIGAKGNSAYYMLEGACVDLPVQADHIKKDFVSPSLFKLIYPMEESRPYSLGLLLNQFEQIGRIQSIEKSLREISQLDDPFNPTKIKKYIDNSDLEPIQFLMKNNGVGIIQQFLSLLMSDPEAFSQSFDNRMYPFFHELMLQSTLMPVLSASVHGSLDEFRFNLGNQSESLKNALKNYSIQKFTAVFQSASLANPGKVRPELFRYVSSLLKFHAKKMESLFNDQKSGSLTTAIDEYAKVYLSDLERKQEIEDTILVKWRDRFISKNIQDFYCKQLQANALKPIYVRLGQAHLDDLEQKLNALFNRKVKISKITIP